MLIVTCGGSGYRDTAGRRSRRLDVKALPRILSFRRFTERTTACRSDSFIDWLINQTIKLLFLFFLFFFCFLFFSRASVECRFSQEPAEIPLEPFQASGSFGQFSTKTLKDTFSSTPADRTNSRIPQTFWNKNPQQNLQNPLDSANSHNPQKLLIPPNCQILENPPKPSEPSETPRTLHWKLKNPAPKLQKLPNQ